MINNNINAKIECTYNCLNYLAIFIYQLLIYNDFNKYETFTRYIFAHNHRNLII